MDLYLIFVGIRCLNTFTIKMNLYIVENSIVFLKIFFLYLSENWHIYVCKAEDLFINNHPVLLPNRINFM